MGFGRAQRKTMTIASLLELPQQSTANWAAQNNENTLSHRPRGLEIQNQSVHQTMFLLKLMGENSSLLPLAFSICQKYCPFLGLQMHHSSLRFHHLMALFIAFLLCISVCLNVHYLIRTAILLDQAPSNDLTWRRQCTPLQYSCSENLMDRGAWQAAVHGVAKSGHD